MCEAAGERKAGKLKKKKKTGETMSLKPRGKTKCAISNGKAEADPPTGCMTRRTWLVS